MAASVFVFDFPLPIQPMKGEGFVIKTQSVASGKEAVTSLDGFCQSQPKTPRTKSHLQFLARL